METFSFILSLSSSVLGVANKYYLLKEKNIGWILGIIAGILFTGYFYTIQFYIYTIVQCGFTLMMVYGYLWNKNTDVNLRKIATIVLTIISLVVFLASTKGGLTALETLCSTTGLWAAYFLASKKRFVGWIMLLFSHSLLAVLTFYKTEYLFAFFQITSAIIALFGVYTYKPRAV